MPVVPTAAVQGPVLQEELLGGAGSGSMTEVAVVRGTDRHAAASRRASTTPGCSHSAAATTATPGAAELMTQAKRPTSPQKRKSSATAAKGSEEEQEGAPQHKRPRLAQASVADTQEQQQQAEASQGQQQHEEAHEQSEGAAAAAGPAAAAGQPKGRSMLEVVLSPLFSVFGRTHSHAQQAAAAAAPAAAAAQVPVAARVLPTAPEATSTASTATAVPPTGTGTDAASAVVAAVAERTHHAHHPPPPEAPVAAESEVDEAEDDEVAELEFDPLLFIRSLPPLEQVVPRHRTALLPRKTRQCKRKTLVLDLDETLVHSTVEDLAPGAPAPDFTLHVSVNHIRHTIHVRRRPHLAEFMATVASLFEVVVFTASQKPYAEQLLNIIDPKRSLVKHRVFRDSCVIVDGNYLKDLTVLGRDMATTCIIDNSLHAFGFQPDNGIPIESWFDDDADTELLKLLPFLKRLAADDVDDVRPLIAAKFRLKEMLAKLPPPL